MSGFPQGSPTAISLHYWECKRYQTGQANLKLLADLKEKLWSNQ